MCSETNSTAFYILQSRDDDLGMQAEISSTSLLNGACVPSRKLIIKTTSLIQRSGYMYPVLREGTSVFCVFFSVFRQIFRSVRYENSMTNISSFSRSTRTTSSFEAKSGLGVGLCNSNKFFIWIFQQFS